MSEAPLCRGYLRIPGYLASDRSYLQIQGKPVA